MGLEVCQDKYNGAATLISRDYPAALYIHCASHRLNLCVAEACKIQAIRNMMTTIRKASYFFDGSPKRQQVLEKALRSIAQLQAIEHL